MFWVHLNILSVTKSGVSNKEASSFVLSNLIKMSLWAILLWLWFTHQAFHCMYWMDTESDLEEFFKIWRASRCWLGPHLPSDPLDFLSVLHTKRPHSWAFIHPAKIWMWQRLGADVREKIMRAAQHMGSGNRGGAGLFVDNVERNRKHIIPFIPVSFVFAGSFVGFLLSITRKITLALSPCGGFPNISAI